MRQIFCLLVLIVVILSVDADNTFAQDEAQSRYQKGEMIEIADLLSTEEVESCFGETNKYAGTVLTIQFTKDLQIDNFTLKTAKGNVKVYLSPALYDGRLSKQDHTALPTLIAKGRRITVHASRCDDPRKILVAQYIIAGIHKETFG